MDGYSRFSHSSVLVPFFFLSLLWMKRRGVEEKKKKKLAAAEEGTGERGRRNYKRGYWKGFPRTKFRQKRRYNNWSGRYLSMCAAQGLG
jgi:hypothetical protein